MIRLVLIASLLAGCRVSLEDEVTRTCELSTSAQCTAADGQASLAWIETNVFQTSCNASGCHGGAAPAGGLDLRPGVSHAHLVNIASKQDTSRMLVVPNDVNSSYLMVMLRAVDLSMATPPAQRPPSGFMPQGSPDPICCQKLDAIERWIESGAPSN